MQRIALFPGTFDPITIGHLDIINRALPLFDKLVIGIGRNINKTPCFLMSSVLTGSRKSIKTIQK
ncbi:adenylyltransferase/cytidyltransferase family protein [Paraflavitalea speifideaquila]|uniref:adenylyltransferase/cytidyltransferase family protein n=1 Tax=Paraflavitalea speifideaquila TaxID=3076558 RepID=UPI0028E9432A|nr:adenylyltransferase/cytidyltransferase family protein [Paraflavitalea speifideiaquila]